MSIKLLSLAIVFCLFTRYCSAQANQNSLEFTPTVGLKVFTPEKNALKGTFWGGELAYHFNMAANEADYVRILHIQSIDAVASYRNMEQVVLHNDPSTKGVLGSTYALLGRLEFRLAKAGPVQFLFMPAVGFLYSTESYFTNPRNSITGSHINIAAQAGLKLFTAVSSSTGIQGGVDVFHYSNGAVRLPNNGVNAYSVSLGLVQKINQQGASGTMPEKEEYKGFLEVGADIGYRGLFEVHKGNYKSGLYLGYNYKLSPVFSVKLATDAGYYYTVFDPNRFVETFQYYGTSYDRWRVGVSVGADVWLGKVAVMANYGHYIHYRTYYPNNQWYWTAGLKYYVLPWVGVQVKGYIHHTQADYIGAGLLFRIH